jgi:hypothetical protein
MELEDVWDRWARRSGENDNCVRYRGLAMCPGGAPGEVATLCKLWIDANADRTDGPHAAG